MLLSIKHKFLKRTFMYKAILPSGVELSYETFGNQSDKPLLLVMGLGAQMLAWRDKWCELLTQQGFYVIRFDNRDVGLSTHIDEAPLPKVKDFFQATVLNNRKLAAYYLKDMAEDAIGLMDYLKIEKAHVCGASMGGMIAQEMAIHFPQRVKSLCLIMTTPGDRRLPKPALKVVVSLFKQPSPKKVEKFLKHKAKHLQVIGSVNGLGDTLEELEAHTQRLHKRASSSRGGGRQSLAIVSSPNRTKALKNLKVPTLIIHGESDPLVKVEHAYALKAAMPHARFELVKDMGHDIPKSLYEPFAKMIAELAQD
jgi:pimeloyl-ACP methyl ester carboxylesterase